MSTNRKCFIFVQNFGKKIDLKKHITFGEHLRYMRESAGKSLREVAGMIDIDPSLLAKIERGQRKPTKQMIKSVSILFDVNEKQLLDEFLSDSIAYKILDEEADLSILKAAEEKVSYLKTLRNG